MIYYVTLFNNHATAPLTFNQAPLLSVTIDNTLHPSRHPPLLVLGLPTLVLREGPTLVLLPPPSILLLFNLKISLFLLTQLRLLFRPVLSPLSFRDLPIPPLHPCPVLLHPLLLLVL